MRATLLHGFIFSTASSEVTDVIYLQVHISSYCPATAISDRAVEIILQDQLSSVQLLSHVRLCDPPDCSTPGLPIHHQLPGFTQTHVHWVSDAIQTISSSVVPFSSRLQSFPASGSFQMNQLFASCGQSIGVSASASVLPVNTQDWFPLGWTGWISLQS